MSNHTGIILDGTHITLAEIFHSPKGRSLVGIGSFQSAINFNDAETFLGKGTSQREKTFVTEIAALCKKIKLKPTKISFGISTNVMMSQTIPVDITLPEIQTERQTQWELQQYFVDAEIENIATGLLPPITEGQQPTSIMVAVQNPVITFLTNVAKKLKSTLHIIDAIPFCAEASLMYNYPQITKRRAMLIGIKEHNFDVNVVYDGKSVHTASFEWTTKNPAEHIANVTEQLQGEIIYLYGKNISPQFVDIIKQNVVCTVEVFDTVRKIAITPSVKEIEELKQHKYEYSSAIGLALRTE